MLYTWSDIMGHRSRSSWLLLVTPEGKVIKFSGESIPGVVAVIGTDYEKNGNYSHTTFRLQLAPGVRPIAGHDGWETGRFVEGLRAAVQFGRPIDRWIDVANAMGVAVSEAMRFLREWRPKAAKALDVVEEAIEAVDVATDEGADIISISFGSPCRREREAGFWDWPVIVTLDKNEVGRITPTDTGWEISGQVKILSEEHASGHGGGYVSMRLVVPAGAKAYHGK